MLGFDGEYPAVHPNAKFWRFLLNNCKKSAVKHSILFTFVNLSPNFCPRLSEETDFHFQLGPNLLILHFLKILYLVSEKAHLLLKLSFKATQLQKMPECDIFQRALFCILASSMNLGTKRCFSYNRAAFMKRFYFHPLKTDHFGSFNAFLNK